MANPDASYEASMEHMALGAEAVSALIEAERD
jgi:hypothetical protein